MNIYGKGWARFRIGIEYRERITTLDFLEIHGPRGRPGTFGGPSDREGSQSACEMHSRVAMIQLLWDSYR